MKWSVVYSLGTAVFGVALLASPGAPQRTRPIEPTEIYNIRAHLFDTPAGLTAQQLSELIEAQVKGEPLPPGILFLETQGDVSGILTGIRDEFGRFETVITVTDESVDLEEVRVYVDSALRTTATRSSGGILDNADGTSTAILTLWTQVRRSQSYLIEWDTAAGRTWTRGFRPEFD